MIWTITFGTFYYLATSDKPCELLLILQAVQRHGGKVANATCEHGFNVDLSALMQLNQEKQLLQ